MGIKKRAEPSGYFNKYCNVVDKLIYLEHAGFEEDGFNNWNLLLRSESVASAINGGFDVYETKLTASGDYLFLKETVKRYSENNDNDTVVIWNRDIAGPITQSKLYELVNLLSQGVNLKKEEDER